MLGRIFSGITKPLGQLAKGKVSFGDLFSLGSMYMGFGAPGMSAGFMKANPWASQWFGKQGGMLDLFKKDPMKAIMGLQGVLEGSEYSNAMNAAGLNGMGLNREGGELARKAMMEAMGFDWEENIDNAFAKSEDATSEVVANALKAMRTKYGADPEGDTNFRVDSNWVASQNTKQLQRDRTIMEASGPQQAMALRSAALNMGLSAGDASRADAAQEQRKVSGAMEGLAGAATPMSAGTAPPAPPLSGTPPSPGATSPTMGGGIASGAWGSAPQLAIPDEFSSAPTAYQGAASDFDPTKKRNKSDAIMP